MHAWDSALRFRSDEVFLDSYFAGSADIEVFALRSSPI